MISYRATMTILLFLLCGAFQPGRASADLSLADMAAAIDAPTLGPRVDLSGPVRIGRGILVPAPGTRVYQLLAGETPCGVHVAGPARFTYRVEDRFSVPVARRNLRRASQLRFTEADGVLEVVEEVKGALVWSWEILAEPISVGAEESLVGLPEWAGEILDQPLFTLPARDLLPARRLGVVGTVWALFEGEKHPLHLVTEPHRDQHELFYRLEKIRSIEPFKGRFAARELAAQPLGRQWWDRFAAALVAESTSILVDNPSDERVVVKTTTQLRATRDGVSLWQPSLVNAIFFEPESRPNRVVAVGIDGRPADYLHRDDELLVALPRRLQQGEAVTVTVINEGDLAVRPQGYNSWSLGTWPWYPQPDLNGELAMFDLVVRVPIEYTPFASGRVVAESDEDQAYSIVHTRLDQPMQFPVVAAGKYSVTSDTRDGVTCRVAAYGGKNERAARKLIDIFFDARRFFEQTFDMPYPFDGFTVVEVKDWGFGQAPPGMIFITQEAFNPLLGDLNRLFSGGVNERYLHEIAHAWWGHVIKMDSFEEQWLTESFASYSAALALEAMHGGGKKGKREFNASLRHWRSQAQRIDEGGSIYLANHLTFDGDADRFGRYRLLYDKGPLVLHALRQQLGDDLGGAEKGDRAFVVLLRSFLENFTYRWGATHHLVGILNQITGKDWQPWFEQYVYGTATPEVTL